MKNSIASGLSIDELTVCRGSRQVLAGVSLSVDHGEVIGLLGQNGAGKTTLMDAVVGLNGAESGAVEVCGLPVANSGPAARRIVGYATQEVALFPGLRVIDNLMHWARLRECNRGGVEKMLHAMVLEHLVTRPVRTLSGGEKRRVHCAIAMLGSPRLVLLDEPTAGVDPTTRAAILSHVRSVADQGAAVLYSTHYLQELTDIANGVVMLQSGRIVYRGRLTEFAAFADVGGWVEFSYIENGVIVERSCAVEDPAEFVTEMVRNLVSEGKQLRSLQLRPPSLDDAFHAVQRRTDADSI